MPLTEKNPPTNIECVDIRAPNETPATDHLLASSGAGKKPVLATEAAAARRTLGASGPLTRGGTPTRPSPLSAVDDNKNVVKALSVVGAPKFSKC